MTTQPKKRRILFKLSAPQANNVVLAGSFNDWSTTKHVMKRDTDGSWQKVVMLPPGHYEYKFIIDGNWSVDPGNGEMTHNEFGTQNNAIDVHPN